MTIDSGVDSEAAENNVEIWFDISVGIILQSEQNVKITTEDNTKFCNFSPKFMSV